MLRPYSEEETGIFDGIVQQLSVVVLSADTACCSRAAAPHQVVAAKALIRAAQILEVEVFHPAVLDHSLAVQRADGANDAIVSVASPVVDHLAVEHPATVDEATFVDGAQQREGVRAVENIIH